MLGAQIEQRRAADRDRPEERITPAPPLDEEQENYNIDWNHAEAIAD